VFCELDGQRILAFNALAVAIHDRHPITPLQSLVIPQRLRGLQHLAHRHVWSGSDVCTA
jgi:hypothetical protein